MPPVPPRFLSLAAVTLAACAAHAAPRTFLDRIPADAMLAAHVDLSSAKVDSILAGVPAPELTHLVDRTRACGLDPFHDVHDIAFALAPSPLRVVVELHGAVTVKQLACVFEAPVASDLPGGGVLITYGPLDARPGAPTGLSAELGRLGRRSTFAAVAAFGRYQVTIEGQVNRPFGVRLRLDSAASAAALHAWLSDALARGREQGLGALSALRPTLHDRVVDLGVSGESSVFLALALRSAVVEAFKIPAGSMMPTLLVGDHIFVAKGAFAHTARRGDVVVFVYPRDRSKDFVKRVVAVGGDRVSMKDDVLSVNGKPVARKSLGLTTTSDHDDLTDRWVERRVAAVQETLGGVTYTTLIDPGGMATDLPELVVPDGHVFVLGDNRHNSSDSRHWGTVPVADIKGRAAVIWYSEGGPAGVRWERIGALIDPS